MQIRSRGVRRSVRLLAAVILMSAAVVRPALAQSSQTPAQSGDSGVIAFFRNTELAGFADIYFGYNFNRPAKPCATVAGVAVFNCLHNFDVAHNSFALNLAEVLLEKKPTADSRGGFRVDFDYGPATAMVHATEPGGTTIFQNIQQAYVSWLAPTGAGLQLDLGKFVTPAGYEVIETKDNWNYSRSLLFALAIPYYHMGLRASYPLSDKISLTGLLLNGWNNATDNNTGKTVAGLITLKPLPALSITETYIGGPEQTGNNDDWRHLSDTVVSYTAATGVSVGANFDYGRDTVAGSTMTWQGVAAYLRVMPNEWFALTPRVEYYDDKDGFTTGVGQKLKEVTVTGELKHKDGVRMRVEYRRDFSDVAFFPKKTTDLVRNQDTFTVGLIYAFSTKTP